MAGRTVRVAGAVVAASLVSGCNLTKPRAHDPSPTTAAILFPINVVPDVVIDFGVLATMPLWVWFAPEGPGTVWPAVWILSPLLGVGAGIDDAARGRPFWRASALSGEQRVATQAPPPSEPDAGSEDR